MSGSHQDNSCKAGDVPRLSNQERHSLPYFPAVSCTTSRSPHSDASMSGWYWCVLSELSQAANDTLCHTAHQKGGERSHTQSPPEDNSSHATRYRGAFAPNTVFLGPILYLPQPPSQSSTTLSVSKVALRAASDLIPLPVHH